MSLWERIARWWCKFRHKRIHRPYRGQYECSECFRTWDATPMIPEAPHV